MKIIILFALIACGFAHANDCRTTQPTKLRLFGSSVEADSVAVDSQGKNLNLNDLLADTPIFFLRPNGTRTTEYQWLYNPPVKVAHLDHVYVADSFGEIVLIEVLRRNESTEIIYTGTQSGRFMNLICTPTN